MLSSVTVRASAVPEDADESRMGTPPAQRGEAQLLDCLGAHASALSLREMDVFEDSAMLRCGECRRHYAITVSSFETHQR